MLFTGMLHGALRPLPALPHHAGLPASKLRISFTDTDEVRVQRLLLTPGSSTSASVEIAHTPIKTFVSIGTSAAAVLSCVSFSA